tara:strand:+ start:119 stop:610 length:492 start_codon:yes stop_codon:yes gene_type:complete
MFDQKIDTILMAMFPVGELRASIPIAIHILKLDWSNALFYSLIGNSLITLMLLYLIDFLKIDRIKYFFTKIIGNFIPIIATVFIKWENSSLRKSKKLKRWGYIGLMFFVSVPLPITGAWTAVLIAGILEFKPFKSFLSITFGLIISGSIITYLSVYVPNFLGY